VGIAAVKKNRALALRSWMGPPRRLRFHRSGWVFSFGTLLLGVAAIATGNNLLFLLLGAMLGFIALSGSLSELVLRKLAVQRRVPRGGTAGMPVRLAYQIDNQKQRLPSFAVEVGESGSTARAFIASVDAGSTTTARVEESWERRGVYPLGTVVLTTSFPFGLFQKELDVELPGEVVIWPRSDRRVREPRPAAERARLSGLAPVGAAGARGEYRGLRPYRPGDDPRDVHWRSTARLGDPVVREYERDRAQALWICLDLRAAEGDDAEIAVEIAAALAAGAYHRGEPFGLASADGRVEAGTGVSQLERVLDALARVKFRPNAPRVKAPVSPRECVLVTPASAAGAAWGDVFIAEREQ
jgi:uncharacterized protein (DUF58 family)